MSRSSSLLSSVRKPQARSVLCSLATYIADVSSLFCFSDSFPSRLCFSLMLIMLLSYSVDLSLKPSERKSLKELVSFSICVDNQQQQQHGVN